MERFTASFEINRRELTIDMRSGEVGWEVKRKIQTSGARVIVWVGRAPALNTIDLAAQMVP